MPHLTPASPLESALFPVGFGGAQGVLEGKQSPRRELCPGSPSTGKNPGFFPSQVLPCSQRIPASLGFVRGNWDGGNRGHPKLGLLHPQRVGRTWKTSGWGNSCSPRLLFPENVDLGMLRLTLLPFPSYHLPQHPFPRKTPPKRVSVEQKCWECRHRDERRAGRDVPGMQDELRS